MQLTLELKPSIIGRYYETQCDKYLVCSSLKEEGYEQIGLQQPDRQEMTAAIQAGVDWEKILLNRLKEDADCQVVDLTAKEGESGESAFEKTVEALKNLKETDKTVYLYQSYLKASDTFTEQYVGDSETVSFSSMLPDFIKAEYSGGKYLLTVIDAKNAANLKKGAAIQIALYVKLLDSILKDKGVENCYVNEEEGIVWNREHVTDNLLEHSFRLKDAFDELDVFLNEKLKDICATIDSYENGEQLLEELHCRFSLQCGYCNNFDACISKYKDKHSVLLMPYMTDDAQQKIRDLIEEGTLTDDSIESVRELLEQEPALLTESCSFWRKVKGNQTAYMNGLQALFDKENRRFAKTGTSHSFPIGQNFALLLTAQQDITTGRVYAYAWLLKPAIGIDVFGLGLNENDRVDLYEGSSESPGRGTYYDSVVAECGDPDELDRVDRVFVESIFELLRRVDNHPDNQQKKLQIFVMDSYERSNIENALFDMLERRDPIRERDLFEKVMAILFWMQGERLVTDSESVPKDCIDNPVTVLTTEIQRLYVLSQEIAYNLRKTASVFSPDFNLNYENQYLQSLTNALEGMHIIRAWEERDEKEKNRVLNSLAYHLRRRLFVEMNIIEAIQSDNRANLIQLSTWPMSFRMQEPAYPDHPEIAKLAFENRYEALLDHHRVKFSRSAGVKSAIEKGSVLWLEYKERKKTYVVLNYDHFVDKNWFTACICEDTPENRIQVMLFRDTARNRYQNIGFYPVEYNHKYNFIRDADGDIIVKINLKDGVSFSPENGKRYILFEVYSDFTSWRTDKGLDKLVDRQELLDPQELSGPTGVDFDDETEAVCSRYWSPDNQCFSESQKEAFVHLLERKLTILQGPPASGKTDFIARSIITIAGYYREKEGKKLKIMVTAQSHSAIENVLLKIDAKLKMHDPCEGEIKVYKVGRYDDKEAFAGSNVKLIKKSNENNLKSVASVMDNDEIQIIGMTSWAAYTEFFGDFGEMRAFDLIVMDEASQIRSMDAVLSLECSHEDTRYLLVGDDDQLSAIIHGKYKETIGEKYIYGSILHMYSTGLVENDPDHPDIISLSDNFRMNEILCKYSANEIYGEEYKAFNESIATQKIHLEEPPEDDLLAFILDPEYPLVFCELSGDAGAQRDAEVQLVTDLVHALRDHQLNEETGNLAWHDGNFWRDTTDEEGNTLTGTCGIISPYHENINRLKRSIAEDLGVEREEIYIGTVDKLQGKERKTVIVSYGISDSEKILNERDFIFNRNRFNVSLTRGKAKTIVLLSNAIAESNLNSVIMSANDKTPDKTLAKGIDFMHGFTSFMKDAEDGEDVISREETYIDDIDVGLQVWKKRRIP